MAITEKSS